MTTDLDSDLNAGTSPTPKGDDFNGKGDSQSSIDATKLQSSIEALTRRLDEVDARSKALQGDKDRAVKKTNDEVSELKRKIAEIEKLKKSGMDEDEALNEFAFREEVRSMRDQIKNINPAQPSPAGNGDGKAVDKAKVISQYGLDANDPEVAAHILGKDFSSELEAENAALKLAYRRSVKQPDISAAPAANGNSVKAQTGLAELTRKYQSDMLAARGRPSELKRIKEEARKNGVPVDSIAFV